LLEGIGVLSIEGGSQKVNFLGGKVAWKLGKELIHWAGPDKEGGGREMKG